MQIVSALVSVVAGLAVSFLIYLALNFVVQKFNRKWEARLLPYVFIGPVLLLIGAFLIYPTIRTFYLSFFNATGKTVRRVRQLHQPVRQRRLHSDPASTTCSGS